MSKLLKLYKCLKSNNKEKIYLFKSGIFYIFLDEDAKLISKALNFKLTNLNSECVKCGFPSNSFTKYIDLIKQLDYDVEIIETNNTSSPIKSYSEKMDIDNLLNEIISIDVNNLSIREAYSFIDKIQSKSKIILNKGATK